MTNNDKPKQQRERPDMGPCPKCAAAGYEGTFKAHRLSTWAARHHFVLLGIAVLDLQDVVHFSCLWIATWVILQT